MVSCTSCGAQAPDASGTCLKCGEPVSGTNGDATAVMSVSDGIQPPSSSTPRSQSTLTRSAARAIADEGRFIPGTLIAGRYRVIGLLGRGGMGEVYRATDLALGQSVALKILPEDAAANEQLLERFHSEVRIARQVSHPNVCRVYDLGEADGIPFISMEFVDGEDLASLLQRIGRLPADKSLEISRKLCAGLAAAHERGIIHRDLKPQNVMLNKRGEVVIMDFGLAAVADQLHGAEARNGTPAYMAPEQLRGESVTARSDIYSLGLMLYELFTGKRAYKASSVKEMMTLQETARPATMSTVAADIDPLVERAILQCLKPNPADRPGSALAVAAALPGGDPLAAALAAGETPSPEMVAAAGKKEGYALRYAVPCLIVALLGIALCPFILGRIQFLSMTPVDYPPAVLENKAREMAVRFGYPKKPKDWVSSMSTDSSRSDYLTYLEKKPGPKNWAQWFAAEPPVRFFYRQSQSLLASDPDGEVTRERPAPIEGGMIAVDLDSVGRLRSFHAVPPEKETDEAAPQVFDPALVFTQAGLDRTQFKEVKPDRTPAVPFDARSAWEGGFPGLPDTPVHIEMTSWHGRLTSFVLRWPWTKDVSPGEDNSNSAGTLFSVLFAAVGLFCVIFFARRHLKMGRGDKSGAFRLAATAFLIYLVACLTSGHPIPSLNMIGYEFWQVSFGLTLCTLIWLAYLALEPALRRRWPHTLITWNRLLEGRVGDPGVGSHILAGIALGAGMWCAFACSNIWLMREGTAPGGVEVQGLYGVHGVANVLANKAWGGITTGLIIFSVTCGLRALLRRDWIAIAAATVLLVFQDNGFQQSKHWAIDVPLFIMAYAGLSAAMIRLGLIPAIVAIFTINLLGDTPVSGDWSSWYNYVTFLQLAALAAIAIYGFWRSQSAASVWEGASRTYAATER